LSLDLKEEVRTDNGTIIPVCRSRPVRFTGSTQQHYSVNIALLNLCNVSLWWLISMAFIARDELVYIVYSLMELSQAGYRIF